MQRLTTGRVVALITPTIIAPAAGFVAVQAAKWGMDVDAMQLQAVFVSGVTAALGIGALWLKGYQDWEKRQDATPAGVSSDLRLEETDAIDTAEPTVDEGDSADAAELEAVAADPIDEELEADGLDDLDDLDDDLDLADDDELVAIGEE